MTKTERFVSEVKSLVHRKGSVKEWDLFSLIAKEFRLGTVRDLAEMLYDATVNRGTASTLRHAYWNIVTASVVADDLSFKELGAIFTHALDQIFEHNQEKGVGRPFKELLGREDIVRKELREKKSSFMQRLFAITLITAGTIDASAINSARAIGAGLAHISRLRRGLQALHYFKKKQYKKAHYAGITLVYSLTVPFVALTPNCSLPELNDKTVQSTAFFKEFAPLALRFPVYESLLAEYKTISSQLEELLFDIRDYHKELTQGGKREQLMVRFKRLLAIYLNIPTA